MQQPRDFSLYGAVDLGARQAATQRSQQAASRTAGPDGPQGGTVTISDAKNAPELVGVRKAIEELQIESLLALPLTEGNDQIGVLILTQDKSRTWKPSEVLVIRTLSDQVLIALNNAGLRRLVKNLSVTDEKSGLLKRASYLDLLQAETRRGLRIR